MDSPVSSKGDDVKQCVNATVCDPKARASPERLIFSTRSAPRLFGNTARWIGRVSLCQS
jgi:hypothetical protein